MRVAHGPRTAGCNDAPWRERVLGHVCAGSTAMIATHPPRMVLAWYTPDFTGGACSRCESETQAFIQTLA